MKNGFSFLDFTGAAQGLSQLNCVSLPLDQWVKGNSGGLFYVRKNAVAPSLLFLAYITPMGVMFLFGTQSSNCGEHHCLQPSHAMEGVHMCLEMCSVLVLCFLSCRIPDLHQRDRRPVSCSLSACESRATAVPFRILKS